ncbi:MAG: hypothetical protein HY211_05260 [Candidatus Omnitrophica bacterium]|nr:hypothetical protein [Candidatus Omnitrophota bacterium]
MAIGILTLVCGLIAGRFSHPFGVAPILGALLCAACFLRPRELFIVGLCGILIRDLFVGLEPFTLVRLIGIALAAGLLVVLKVRPSFRSMMTGLLVSSPVFHLTLAVGDWWTGTCSILPRTPQGLLTAILQGFPYFLRSFVGDLAFTGFFLGAYLLAATTFWGWKVQEQRES